MANRPYTISGKRQGRVYMLRTVSLLMYSASLCALLTGVKATEPPKLPAPFVKAAHFAIAPSTPIQDFSGKQSALNDWRGKFVILNVWATWCGPCVKELPALDRLAASLPPDRYAVLLVSQDKGGTAVAKPFLEKLKLATVSNYSDPGGKLSRDLGIRGLPTTVILDPDGLVLGRLEGPAEWDREAFVGPIRAMSE